MGGCMNDTPMRIGVDLGGSKIAVAALADDGATLFEQRAPTPKGDYDGCIRAICALVEAAEAATGKTGGVGVGIPGSISPKSGLVQNANSTWLNGRALKEDLQAALGREARFANDANCFALSEAVDGAAKDASIVFGVIIGTGCGGGVVIDKKLINGPKGIGGEWGHIPLPWANTDETPGPECWCGHRGCLETWISGTGLAADYRRLGGEQVSAEQLPQRANAGDAVARMALQLHATRLARGLAMVINMIDPDIIVLGGGLSNMPHLYAQLPALVAPYIFSDNQRARIVPPQYGDASGVRGAARL